MTDTPSPSALTAREYAVPDPDEFSIEIECARDGKPAATGTSGRKFADGRDSPEVILANEQLLAWLVAADLTERGYTVRRFVRRYADREAPVSPASIPLILRPYFPVC